MKFSIMNSSFFFFALFSDTQPNNFRFQLADSDAESVVPLLWNVWCSEKGIDSKREIKQCGSAINSGDPELLFEVWRRLEALSAQYPNWAEPYNRLATIKFHQKEFDLARNIYQKALDLKPWLVDFPTRTFCPFLKFICTTERTILDVFSGTWAP